ncbi:disulfide bond formation protein DsbA [Streptomyces sp. WAC 06738]|uniref:DsbA family protein n=1 Tax=Streptomyces sp. WAC 06738 TaxID=2203210 RepID=UPI000F6D4D57|nr:thioredoxin domain-containing protein [Streptomyces sp. WAC 06738]AZM47443.1 disulfide bond formation protein DsbA [Streptomyces sp. WAC 06738]
MPENRTTTQSRNKKKHLYATVIIAGVFVAVFALAAAFLPGDDSPGDATPAADARVVRADSHRLTSPADSELTLVEFLDFECEACGAYYPAVEKLRERYGDRVTFIARYFPMPGHRNGELAARAAEAAARQDKFDEMYRKLFDTQAEWGEAQESKEDVFRGFARELGLDMARFDRDLAAPRTADRVRADQRDGLALDVQGTPTFFLGGEKISNPQSYEDFAAAIDEALAR